MNKLQRKELSFVLPAAQWDEMPHMSEAQDHNWAPSLLNIQQLFHFDVLIYLKIQSALKKIVSELWDGVSFLLYFPTHLKISS